jgi:CelD/BcsL family acetyltransferase involved in cellulose biosynthesis
MHVLRYDNLNDLAAYADQWDTLAQGVPFRTWNWATTWWRHYGPLRRRRLYVLAVLDEAGHLAGLAPCYSEPSATMGRTLRLLGSGEVCSDYLGLMCRPGLETAACESMAHWLLQQNAGNGSADDRWDSLRLEGVDAEDRPTLLLAEQLAQNGAWVYRRPGACCWRVQLPPTWEQYLRGLSKSHRKQVCRAENRLLALGRAVFHSVASCNELARIMQLLEDLHQRRRRQLGQAGCFASHRFAAFHRDVVGPMLAAGQLQLHWLELDGRPISVEYHLAGNGIVYAYQAGVEPDALQFQPGSLITQACLRRAVEHGFRAFDFLRGDEPYKAHWRAVPRTSLEIRVAANHAGARLRQRMWLAGSQVKRLLCGDR